MLYMMLTFITLNFIVSFCSWHLATITHSYVAMYPRNGAFENFWHPAPATAYVANSCNMGTSDLSDMYVQGLRAYISGKSRVPLLQLICNTFSVSYM